MCVISFKLVFVSCLISVFHFNQSSTQTGYIFYVNMLERQKQRQSSKIVTKTDWPMLCLIKVQCKLRRVLIQYLRAEADCGVPLTFFLFLPAQLFSCPPSCFTHTHTHTPVHTPLCIFFSFYISLMWLLAWSQFQSWLGHGYVPKVPVIFIWFWPPFFHS